MFDHFFNQENEIPKEFHSDSNEKPFSQCSVCENSLKNQGYIIEKSFKKYPNTQETFTAFEYAICMNCKQNMMSQISKSSMRKIQEYVQRNQNQILSNLEEIFDNHLDKTMRYCNFSKKSIDEMEEYNMIGFFMGNKMIQSPMIFGEEMIDEYANLLSNETLDFFDDFMNDITDLPPSLAKLLDVKKSPVIF